MKRYILAAALAFSFVLPILTARSAAAEDFLSEPEPEREPAAISNPLSIKRNYPGAADEEELRVQTTLPEAAIKTDSRSLQREVYKALYNQELKDERIDAVEE